jgi:hypothetical protein
MKMLILQGFPNQLKMHGTDTSPVQKRKPSHCTQLQEKAFRQVKHLHRNLQANAIPTSVRSIANLYFLERRFIW